MSNLILPPSYKSKLQSGFLPLNSAINYFLKENENEKFESYAAIFHYKNDNETRIFYGSTRNYGSRPYFENLYYLSACLRISFNAILEQAPMLKTLEKLSPSIVPPSHSPDDLITLLKKERNQISAVCLVFGRGEENKFTHGIDESLKGTDVLEAEANLLYGITTTLFNVNRIMKSFPKANQNLIKVVNPDHRVSLTGQNGYL